MTRSTSAKISSSDTAGFRRGCIQLRENCARLGVRRNRALRDVLAIIRDPVRYFVKMLAKNIRRDVAEFRYRVLRVSLHSFVFYGGDAARRVL